MGVMIEGQATIAGQIRVRWPASANAPVTWDNKTSPNSSGNTHTGSAVCLQTPPVERH
jgi:hypothetical protein